MRRLSCCVVAAIALAVAASTAVGGPLARRCIAGGVPLLVGKRALLVRTAASADRDALYACRRGARRGLALGATYGNDVSTNPRARSTLTGAAIGGSVVAVGFEVALNGCLYAHGCAGAPRQVLRLADTNARTLRRIPLRGTLSAVTVSAGGIASFRVDEFACTTTYRTAASPGSHIRVVRRVPTRVPGADGVRLCSVRGARTAD